MRKIKNKALIKKIFSRTLDIYLKMIVVNFQLDMSNKETGFKAQVMASQKLRENAS